MREQPATILCVDDEEPALQVRKMVLEAQGYRVLGASCAEAALELFCTNHVDLVITDHLLSTVTGTELARRMKQLKPTVPIALLTGLPEPPEGAQHADCYLAKGGDLESLFHKISELIRSNPHDEKE